MYQSTKPEMEGSQDINRPRVQDLTKSPALVTKMQWVEYGEQALVPGVLPQKV